MHLEQYEKEFLSPNIATLETCPNATYFLLSSKENGREKWSPCSVDLIGS